MRWVTLITPKGFSQSSKLVDESWFECGCREKRESHQSSLQFDLYAEGNWSKANTPQYLKNKEDFPAQTPDLNPTELYSKTKTEALWTPPDHVGVRWERGDESHISALTLVVNEARCVYVLLEAVLKIPTEQGGAPSWVKSHWLLLKNRLTEYWRLEPRKLGPGAVISLLILNMRRLASFY